VRRPDKRANRLGSQGLSGRASLSPPSSTAPGPEAQRRIITMLFCDVQDSTSLAEQLDPEEWAEVMNSAFGYLIRPIYRYEGTVARLMGDAVLAFFGAPVAHEDDPQRAVRAGLEIIEGVQSFARRFRQQRGLDFAVRVGINTGLVVMGQIGFEGQVEYTAMGDAINVAARMEQTAEPGTVRISEHTYRLVAPLFDVEPLGKVGLRGKSEPVAAYRVLGLKSEPGRLRGIDGLETPLIGRREEMALLRKAVAGVRLGRGQIVSLVGEAGLGKSRLIDELRAEWSASADLLWRESRGLSYATSQPYAAFLDLVRHMCGVRESDSPDLVRERIGCNCLHDSTPPEECDRARRALEVLLGVESDGGGLEGEAFKRELFQVMLGTWQRWAAVQPVVLVLDDLHWADPASAELLVHLFRLADRAGILFLCAFRPDRHSPAWRIKQAAEVDFPHRYTEIVLEPLTTEETSSLVDHLLTVADLPDQLRHLVLEKAEGNPFYVEEVVRSLVEAGVLARDASGTRWQMVMPVDKISIPESLQALLVARVDRLDEAARHVLQFASVAGRSFYHRVLQMVLERELDLDEQLRVLQRAGLIREAARVPEVEYAFRHALTQEAAYRSILHRRRREMHGRVAEVLESVFAERLDEFAPRLAHHFDQAWDARAVHYYLRAADAALRLYANHEAVAHYSRALELARRPGVEAPPWKRLYLGRGRALELASRYKDARDGYREAEELARAMGDRELELAVLVASATIHASPTPVHDVLTAQDLCDRALSLARELGDRESEARVLWNLLLLHERSGRAQQALVYGERSLAVARELGLREQLAYTLHDLAQVYLDVGQVERGRAVLLEARGLWQEMDNRPMLADSLTTHTLFGAFTGEYEQAIRFSDEAFAISQAIDNRWGQAYSRMYVGLAYHARGEMGRARDVMQECIRLAEEAGFVAPLLVTRCDLALVYGDLGAVDEGLDLVRLALTAPSVHMNLWWNWAFIRMAELYLLKGDLAGSAAILTQVQRDLGEERALFTPLIMTFEPKLALAQGDYARAEALAGRYSTLEAWGLHAFVPDMLCYLGRALLAQGRNDAARSVLLTARQKADALGARRLLWPILAGLAEAMARGGDAESAADLRSEAVAVVDFIAEHTGSTELRASFLAQPRVRGLLEA
jgi:class 3 adenylate cyclase/tetratricopeptide (TPR) repeat protein